MFHNVAWQVSGAIFDSSGEQFQRNRLSLAPGQSLENDSAAFPGVTFKCGAP